MCVEEYVGESGGRRQGHAANPAECNTALKIDRRCTAPPDDVDVSASLAVVELTFV